MSYTFLLSELEDAVKVGSPEKREETLRRITSLFLDKSDHLNEQQIGVFGECLVHLISKDRNQGARPTEQEPGPGQQCPN